MRFRIQHKTCYTYDQPVVLGNHTVRLQPRSDVTQTLHQLQWTIHPSPESQSASVDLDGNNLLHLRFSENSTPKLEIHTELEVETHRTNPFDYLAAPWAVSFPLDYPSSLASNLQPYLSPAARALDAEVIHLAESILQEVDGNVSYFLTTLSQRIHDQCQYQVRIEGAPLPAGITWRQRQGSCRDFTMLFIGACQAVGLAARFVSGYEAGDPEQDRHDLHAWAEVYIPGGGWRGFDPTLGLAVADSHVALVASPFPLQTVPVSGRLKTSQGSASLDTQIHLSLA